MSKSFLDKSTMITQFNEYYNTVLSDLLENPDYLHLNLDMYIDKYGKECHGISEKKNIIAIGGFGEIFECHVDTLSLIVKRIPINYPYNKYLSDDNIEVNNDVESGNFYYEYIDRFLNEIIINIILQNKNTELFCKLHGFKFIEDIQNEEIIGYFYIIMENCGDKFNCNDVTLSNLLEWFIEIAEALKIMHNNNIVHNDIAYRNILVIDAHVKLIDFGMSEITFDTELYEKDIYDFGKMMLDIIERITLRDSRLWSKRLHVTDDLGDFMPLQPIIANIISSDVCPTIDQVLLDLHNILFKKN